MFNNLLASLNDFLYSYILIFLLVAAGIYFSIRTKFVQFRLIGDAIKALKEKAEKNDNGKSVSSFQALMISTASRVGTGNIAGIATAIVAGGPGAVFWMWVMAIVGGASAFVESTLAQVYKVKDGKEFRGGPSYYIERALGKRWLGVLFSILLIACFAYGFNGLQTYNMSSALEYYIPNYSDTILPAVVGLLIAAATVSHPVKQGMVQVLSVFIDTLMICTTTAFILLLSGVTGIPEKLDGIPYVQAAISANVGSLGIHFITFSIFAFAFTSLIGNYYYAESNILFIKNNRILLNVFRITCLIAIFLGAQADFSTVWNLADVLMGFMAIENILVIFLLGGIAFKVLDDYTKQKKQGIDPVFKAKNVGLNNTDTWK